MKKIDVSIVHAFTCRGQGGNPAGIILDADGLTHQQKLTLASNLNLSETAFVSKSDKADIKLEFFTPTKQIPHCGHATIAAFSLLRRLGMIKTGLRSKETTDGVREVHVQSNEIFMEQQPPKYQLIARQDELLVLKSLGLNSSDLLNDFTMEIVNTGNSFIILPVRDESVLKKMKVNQDLIASLSRKYDLVGFYPFVASPDLEFDAYTRMFAPYYGIMEESATGMAAGTLSCYLYDRMNLRKEVIKISQGKFMKPSTPSEIIVKIEANHHKILKVLAGGSARILEKTQLEV